jgi:hypothetical protein
LLIAGEEELKLDERRLFIRKPEAGGEKYGREPPFECACWAQSAILETQRGYTRGGFVGQIQ